MSTSYPMQIYPVPIVREVRADSKTIARIILFSYLTQSYKLGGTGESKAQLAKHCLLISSFVLDRKLHHSTQRVLTWFKENNSTHVL